MGSQAQDMEAALVNREECNASIPGQCLCRANVEDSIERDVRMVLDGCIRSLEPKPARGRAMSTSEGLVLKAMDRMLLKVWLSHTFCCHSPNRGERVGVGAVQYTRGRATFKYHIPSHPDLVETVDVIAGSMYSFEDHRRPCKKTYYYRASSDTAADACMQHRKCLLATSTSLFS